MPTDPPAPGAIRSLVVLVFGVSSMASFRSGYPVVGHVFRPRDRLTNPTDPNVCSLVWHEQVFAVNSEPNKCLETTVATGSVVDSWERTFDRAVPHRAADGY